MKQPFLHGGDTMGCHDSSETADPNAVQLSFASAVRF